MDGIVAAVIGLIGGLLAAILVARHQTKNTRTLIAAELDKLERQNRTATRARKEQWLLDSAPALLAASDPQLHAVFDYTTVVTLIHKIQIILDPNNPLEHAINEASSEIGFAVQDALTERRSMTQLLSAQNKLIVAVRKYLHAL